MYCLLGAAIYGWHMVGLDVTDVALEWSQRHIDSNPQLASLLEVRRSTCKVGHLHLGLLQGLGWACWESLQVQSFDVCLHASALPALT